MTGGKDVDGIGVAGGAQLLGEGGGGDQPLELLLRLLPGRPGEKENIKFMTLEVNFGEPLSYCFSSLLWIAYNVSVYLYAPCRGSVSWEIHLSKGAILEQ